MIKNKPTYLKDLILLFAIPIAIVLVSAIAVHTPRLLANPQYDFIFSACGSYACSNTYSVNSSGNLSVQEEEQGDGDYYYSQSSKKPESTLYYHSTEDDSTKKITLEDAKQYHLNNSSKSPDGYSLVRDDGQKASFFGDTRDGGWYLKDGAKKKPVELLSGGDSYSQKIDFLGWVKK